MIPLIRSHLLDPFLSMFFIFSILFCLVSNIHFVVHLCLCWSLVSGWFCSMHFHVLLCLEEPHLVEACKKKWDLSYFDEERSSKLIKIENPRSRFITMTMARWLECWASDLKVQEIKTDICYCFAILQSFHPFHSL